MPRGSQSSGGGGAAEGLFDKEPAPPPPEIHNLTAPQSSPGDPIDIFIFNASNKAEDISLVRNQGLEDDDDIEPAPENVPSVGTPAADTLFEGQTWGWDDIDRRSVVAYNHNNPSFKKIWIPQSLSYINIFIHCLHLKWLRIVLLSSTSRDVKEADIASLTYEDLLRYLGLWILISIFYVWNRGDFWSVIPFDQDTNPFPYLLGQFMSKCRFNAITH